MWSGSLWLLLYRAADIVADLYVWVVATAVAFLITLIAGVALQRHDNREEVGDGVLRGAAILAIVYVLWGCCAFAFSQIDAGALLSATSPRQYHRRLDLKDYNGTVDVTADPERLRLALTRQWTERAMPS